MPKGSFSCSEEWQINTYVNDRPSKKKQKNPTSTEYSGSTPMSVLAGAGGSRISLFNNLQSCSISPLWITAQSQNKKNEMLFFWICQNTLIPHFHSLISTFQMFVKNSIPSEDVPVSIHQYFWCQHITENFKKIKLFSMTS